MTVYDGQTIIIGGLISELYEYTEESIPLLGDLPLVGFLFRGEKEELVRNELVIVLTPHVIKSPADHDRIEQLTNDQVDLISLPPNLLEQIRKARFDSEGIFEKDGDRLQLKELLEVEEDQGVKPTEDGDAPRGEE